MFWDNFYHLCELKNTTPNAVCKQLNLSTATATHWKNGTMPKGDVLLNIANLLDCSVDYLLGRDTTPRIIIDNSVGKEGGENYIGTKNVDDTADTNYLVKAVTEEAKKLSKAELLELLSKMIQEE